MNTSTTISLSDNWRYAAYNVDGWSRGFERLYSLQDWICPEHKHVGGIFFMHQFFLEPTDFCVRYVLHIGAAPSGFNVGINGQTIPYEGTQPFVVDVTDAVRLEDNQITFDLRGDAEGKFGTVYLEQVPCE